MGMEMDAEMGRIGERERPFGVRPFGVPVLSSVPGCTSPRPPSPTVCEPGAS